MPSLTTSVSASGTLIAAPAAGYISVLGYQITSAVNPGQVKLRSATTDKAIVGSFSSTGGGICCPPVSGNSEPYFNCAVGEALTVTLTNAVATDINIQYVIRGN